MPMQSMASASRHTQLSTQLQTRLEAFQQSEAGRSWQQYRQGLPVWDIRRDILEALAVEDVLVVGGDTGCGKTTQVSVFLRTAHAIPERRLTHSRPARHL